MEFEDELEASLAAAEPEDDREPCPVCGEPIRKGARKCIECSSDIRGWRSYLSIGSINVALLTSRVAVVTTAYPGVHRMLMSEGSVINVKFLAIETPGSNSTSKPKLRLAVTNKGRSPGAVYLQSINLTIARPFENDTITSLAIIPTFNDFVISSANSSKIMSSNLTEFVLQEYVSLRPGKPADGSPTKRFTGTRTVTKDVAKELLIPPFMMPTYCSIYTKVVSSDGDAKQEEVKSRSCDGYVPLFSHALKKLADG
jgi:hypothetical protein